MKLKWLIFLSLITMLALSACSSQPAPSATPPATKTTSAASPSPTSPQASAAGATFGQLSQQGATIYAAKCANCHGNKGEGGQAPAVIGSNANLAKYNTAQGLLSFVAATMPRNAPGSLSHQDYLNVTAYMLVQNNKTPDSAPFNEGQLGTIVLK
jgi:cytochrome c